jgi:hypothetical protein
MTTPPPRRRRCSYGDRPLCRRVGMVDRILAQPQARYRMAKSVFEIGDHRGLLRRKARVIYQELRFLTSPASVQAFGGRTRLDQFYCGKVPG